MSKLSIVLLAGLLGVNGEQCDGDTCVTRGSAMIQQRQLVQKLQTVDEEDDVGVVGPELEYSEYDVDEGDPDEALKKVIYLQEGEGTDNSQAWLAATNAKRAKHGSPPVTWNNAMAANALSWVKVHSGHSKSYNLQPPIGPAGENLAANTRATVDIPWAVTAWYDEIKDCGPLPGCVTGKTGVVGHFTALVWKGVKEMGCATFRDTSSGWTRYICQYKGDDTLNCNTPNMGGCYDQQVPARLNPPAASAAPTSAPTSLQPQPRLPLVDQVQLLQPKPQRRLQQLQRRRHQRQREHALSKLEAGSVEVVIV